MISHSQSNEKRKNLFTSAFRILKIIHLQVNQVFKMFSLETLTVYCIYIVINWYSDSLLGIRLSWITNVYKEIDTYDQLQGV